MKKTCYKGHFMKGLCGATAIALSTVPFMTAASAQPATTLTYAQPLSPAGISAVQQRLKQAGAYTGSTDEVWGRDSAPALERFQRSHGLQAAGQLNQATVATLGRNPAELLAPAPPAAWRRNALIQLPDIP
jgi:peptidoglycan hydrolase-like protein with peptidoglycan-binding domain